MFSYPLTFSNEEEHISHIKNNGDFYRHVLDMKETNEELEIQKKANDNLQETIKHMFQQLADITKQKNEQQEELEKTKELLTDTVKLEELLNKKSGISVVHKGICDEKYVEIVMKEIASENYIVDNTDGVKKMDVRLHRKDGQYTIGIECKDKDTVTKADIDKFRRDKVLNKFHRSVFISTCPIKGIIEKDNEIFIDQDELFIVTKDHVFLGAVMKFYLSSLEEGREDCYDNKKLFDSVLDTYSSWQSSKKQLLKMDQAFLRCLRLNPDFDKVIKGHLYFVPSSKIKEKAIY